MSDFHVELSNQQEKLQIAADFLGKMSRTLEVVGRQLVLVGRGIITELEEIEVTLLDDEEMARVHGEFLADATTTDVITFEHGEILIGVEVAERQRLAYGNTLESELLLYGIHGLLHLADFDDVHLKDREKMWARQDELLREFKNNCL